ncbi:MAG: ketoacyl-ACP synthase III [Candidatus Omnitrophica bacterium]|nr:ketoacyl-ACP synthase III [Candidatus Omnitrophota bacterium]MBU0881533.1 ketoacyl-ACP synthase III [Candidatus Omnitrophota bacterium]MBU0895413.1 ketoacyl-ACP synthase III [Candidatus Omnitrophota bacterium]MBU1808957.1 ketoacyl-ACP synthase III [Candidatus Omnitrophota bacterium]
MINAKITHIEYYLPEKIVTNEDLAKDNPDWNFKLIEPKTGILSRHIVGEGESASDLAIHAAELLIEKNGIDRSTIDALLFCTQSPDYILPTTACAMQERLKLSSGTAAFDFNLGCSGYIYGLAIAGAMVNSGISTKVMLLCAETYSKYIAADDRTARTVFGDGGSATLIESSEASGALGPFVLGTDGKGKDKIMVSAYPDERLHIDGAAVFMFTMNKVPACVTELLAKAKKNISDIDLFVFHQASKVVIDNIVRILSLDESKVFRGYEDVGNTVSASIPIALKQAQEDGRVKKGDLIMLVGFGVGYSWGATLIRWKERL